SETGGRQGHRRGQAGSARADAGRQGKRAAEDRAGEGAHGAAAGGERLVMILSLLLASLTATASAQPASADVGEEIHVEVAATGGEFSGSASVSAGKMPDGIEIGGAQGPRLERQIQIVNNVQTQFERLVWVY